MQNMIVSLKIRVVIIFVNVLYISNNIYSYQRVSNLMSHNQMPHIYFLHLKVKMLTDYMLALKLLSGYEIIRTTIIVVFVFNRRSQIFGAFSQLK